MWVGEDIDAVANKSIWAGAVVEDYIVESGEQKKKKKRKQLTKKTQKQRE